MEQNLKNILNNIINTLGYGFQELVYQKAIAHDLRKLGYKIDLEVVKEIIYDGEVLSNVRLDILVDNKFIIETKTLVKISEKEVNQVQRYKKIAGIDEAYLININYKNYEIRKIKKNVLLKIWTFRKFVPNVEC